MNKVIILASGALGNHVINSIKENVKVLAIATDKNSKEIMDYAIISQIPVFVGNPRNGKLSKFLDQINCDILLSVNYLFLVEKEIIDRFKFPINFHGSLLPKYRGRTPHVWAIINNEIHTGVTAHFIDEECDAGDIVYQQEFEISSFDTGGSILYKFFNEYPKIVMTVVNMIDKGIIEKISQNEAHATYYGKRMPEDGHINWEWQKERIFNWVRALASPYPCAFSIYKDEKLIIDEIRYSEIGFNYEVTNGTILSTQPLVVKTCNGTITITKYKYPNNHPFELYTVLK